MKKPHDTPLLDQVFLVDTLKKLVSINSVNPKFSEESPGEGEIAAYVGDLLASMGLDVSLHEVAPRRYNVVGIKKGRGTGKSLMLNGHLDTVGAGDMESPFTPAIIDGKLYGRGSQDMKSGLAVILAAVKAFQDAQVELNGDLIVTGVCDEEHASMGMKDLLTRCTADAAIVTEPTELVLTTAHRGFVWLEVETFGHATHGSNYKEGIDAIMHMGRFLNRLEALGNKLVTSTPHPLVGHSSLHASRINGGIEVLTYPAHCYLEMEWRTTPDQDSDFVSAELQKILDDLAKEDPKFRSEMRVTVTQPPYEIDVNSWLARLVQSSLEAHLVEAQPPRGTIFWTDAALLMQAGIPTAIVGPTGSGLHSDVEWVDLQSCYDLGNVLIDIIARAIA